ncbi:MAG: hypothetical protein AUK54_03285 [Helicobacteraceae bacterium CG2_30_36_10]|nr:MAG: hypothetical protein AUK54_03285 [Helicobacteraceae bacterium CG2_30_36_10]
MKVKNKIVLSALAATIVAFTGCGESSSSTPAPVVATPNCNASYIDVVLSGVIAGQTLDANKTYGLDGKVKLSSGTLTIPAGTTIAGCTGASFMIIAPGADINATGTQAAPITFTSQANLIGTSPDGTAGEWGGLTLLGNGYTYNGVVTYEADAETFGLDNNASDTESSGVLKYVVIKNSGYEVEVDKELNGLSLAGVGSGTVIENIAILGGLDDGIEFWGGSVNVTGLYVKGAQDDSIDTDLGYNGTITNAYVVQTTVDKTNAYDSSALEMGNDTNQDHAHFERVTKPTITKLTAEVTGSGIYMKNDAGLVLSNAKFTSAKSVDDNTSQLVTYRTSDVMVVDDMNVSGVTMDHGIDGGDAATYFSKNNSKDTNTTHNAYEDWTTNVNIKNDVTINNTSATGATIADIWKGKAGSNDAL